MSKQLTFSALCAAFSMALMALAAANGQFALASSAPANGTAPLFGIEIAVQR